MEEKKKRRRVRRKKPVKPKKKQNIPTMEEREEEATEFRDLTPPVYADINWNRLNSIPDYREKLKEGCLENLIGICFSLTAQQLTDMASDPHLTILERTVLQQFQKALPKKDKDTGDVTPHDEDTLRYLQSRFAGKPRDRVEHTGNVGQSLEVKTKEIFDVKNMSRDQRREFKTLLKQSLQLPTTQVNIEEEE